MNAIQTSTIQTASLEVGYEEDGPTNGPPVLLLHGWPDAPRGWRKVAARLNREGWRTIVPYLRGTSPTRFLTSNTPREAAPVILAQDAIDLADALQLDRFAVLGHDWGARAGYTMAALYPERLSALVTLGAPYQPRGQFSSPGFPRSRRFWYQWFHCTTGGSEAVRRNPVAFARIQWDTWGPTGWFDEEEFAATAESFTDPEWVEITLRTFRARWLAIEPGDPRYAPQQERLAEVKQLDTPTLMIQGASDYCEAPEDSEGLDPLFTAEYRRLVLPGVGHFPHREAADTVADAAIDFLDRHSRPAA